MKKCSTCKIEKEETEFDVKYKDTGKLQYSCKSCTKIYGHDWYERNKQRRILYVRNREKELVEFLQEIKNKLFCIKCGENDPVTFDFHHRDPQEKEYNIGEMVHKGFSKEKILKEIEKCDTLCANCHRKEHFYNK